MNNDYNGFAQHVNSENNGQILGSKILKTSFKFPISESMKMWIVAIVFSVKSIACEKHMAELPFLEERPPTPKAKALSCKSALVTWEKPSNNTNTVAGVNLYRNNILVKSFPLGPKSQVEFEDTAISAKQNYEYSISIFSPMGMESNRKSVAIKIPPCKS